MKTGMLLVAEDDPDDQVLIQDALETLPAKVDLHFVENGYELMDYLNKNKHARRMPKLILLDLNMPGKDGRAALREIKTDPHLSKITIVILTTSKAEEDSHYCHGFGVQGYYQKPSSFIELTKILNKVVSEHM